VDTDNIKHMNLRAEAAAFPVEALTVTQGEAFKRIVSLIAEAVEALKHAPRGGAETEIGGQLPSWLDLSRSNRTVLLTGDRGSGKTSVLFSLIRACVHPEDIDRAERIGQISLTAQEKNQLVRLKRHVVWLEPIDMDPLPGPANLLAAILVRIEAATRDRFSPGEPVSRGGGSRRGPPGILDAAPGYLDALQEFHRLQTDVALAWEGNLRERGAHIDPDTYAVEALRAERARLLLNRSLSDSLDALAKQSFRACGGADPLFVLPVDDVDLNPLRCLEILRLLRMITVPRLLFMVLGNTEMIEVALNLKYSGDFTEVMKGGGVLETLTIDPEYIAATGGTLALDAMRKLLPDGQRVRIRSMEVKESLNYRPADAESAKPLRMHALIGRCLPSLPQLGNGQTMGDTTINSLRDFLLFPNPPMRDNDDVEDEHIDRCVFFARSIFRMTPRRAADWWHALNTLESSMEGDPKKKWQKAVDVLGRYLRSTISEDHYLLPKVRLKYREGLRKNVTGHWECYMPVTPIPQHGLTVEIPIPAGNVSSSGPRIIVRKNEGWRLYPATSEVLSAFFMTPFGEYIKLLKEEAKLAEGPVFSTHTASAFFLFHDLLTLGPESNTVVDRFRVRPPVGRWAFTEWCARVPDRIIVLWPNPNFLSTWEYDIFLDYWNNAICKITTLDIAAITKLVYAWIDGGAAVLARQTPFGTTLEEEQGRQALAERMENLIDTINQPYPTGRMTQVWLIRLANLLMPEVSAFPKESLKAFACMSKLVCFWNRHWRDIEAFSDNVIDLIFNKPEKVSEEVKQIAEGTKITDTPEATEMKQKRNEYLDELGVKRARSDTGA